MPTQYTDDNLPSWQEGDEHWHQPVIDLVLALAGRTPIASLLVLPLERPSTTRNVRIRPGTFKNAAGIMVSVAQQTLLLPDNATNLVWLTNVGLPAYGAAWPAATDIIPLATVTTAAGVVIGVADMRVSFTTVRAS